MLFINSTSFKSKMWKNHVKTTFPYSAPAMITSPAPLIATGKLFSPKIARVEHGLKQL
jgi:hypothetical protein